MNSSVIIVAAGNGTRFKGEIPKQYVRINNETILNMTVRKFINLDQIRYIQPVINIKHENIYNETIKNLKSLKNFKKILPPCFGGNERCVSVKKGLIAISKLEDNPNKVLIHDAARPNLSPKSLKNLWEEGSKSNVGAILATQVSETLKKQVPNENTKINKRNASNRRHHHRDVLLKHSRQ